MVPVSLPEVTRIRGPVDLPEALQGRTLGETLHKTADYLLNTPQGLPAAWANALQRRLAPVLEVLRTSREALGVAEDQLQGGADNHNALLRDYEKLAEQGRALWNALQVLVTALGEVQIEMDESDYARHVLDQTAGTFDHNDVPESQEVCQHCGRTRAEHAPYVTGVTRFAGRERLGPCCGLETGFDKSPASSEPAPWSWDAILDLVAERAGWTTGRFREEFGDDDCALHRFLESEGDEEVAQATRHNTERPIPLVPDQEVHRGE